MDINKTLELAEFLSKKYKNVTYYEDLITKAQGGIYLPISNGNAKKEAIELEHLIEEFISCNDKSKIGAFHCYITPSKKENDLVQHPKNFIKNLSNGFNHIQSDYGQRTVIGKSPEIIVKNITIGKNVEFLNVKHTPLCRSIVFDKNPKYWINNLITFKTPDVTVRNIQANNMCDKGKRRYKIVGGVKRKVEDTWYNKYFYFFISEIM